jgi:HD-like signal output (HDOD) protein
MAGTTAADDALLAGLLHDIGYWILAHQSPAQLKDSLELAAREGLALNEAELRILGASHAQIGAYLLGLWGLPFPVIEAVAHHDAPQGVTQAEFDVLGALAVAHALSPTDDSDAFSLRVVAEPKVDARYLAALKATFDWEEAARRVASSPVVKER